jgi:acetyltransferase-like isoleucine patch superfamily enzyme
MTPLRISGEHRIEIGNRVFIGRNSWLQALPGGSNKTAISIGSGVSIAGLCVISATHQVVLEDDVLLARNVYISDHIHKYTDTKKPIREQGIGKISPVLIRRGAWIGQNVVICPGVTIGIGSVIGANSVVNSSIPDYCMAVGSPARIVKSFALTEKNDV